MKTTKKSSDLLGQQGESNSPIITGKVTSTSGTPLPNITITAYNKNLRTEIELGSSTTNASGEFTISYETPSNKSEYKTADLIFRLTQERKKITAFTVIEIRNNDRLSVPNNILFNSRSAVRVEIIANVSAASNGPSEFDQLTALITPLLEQVPIDELNENERHQDFTFLSGETGFDQHKIVRYALSHRMMKQSRIDAEFWYALTSGPYYDALRQTFVTGNLDINLPIVIASLVSIAPATASEIIKLAFAQNTIASRDERQLSKWIKQFRDFVGDRILNPTAGDVPTRAHLLATQTRITAKQQKQFVRLYHDHGKTDEAFWKTLAKDKAFSETDIERLKFADALPGIADGNERVIRLVDALPHVNSMRELALKLNADSLSKVLTSEMLPDNVKGNTAKAKIKQYSIHLQNRLFEAETSAVLQRMVANKEIPIKDDQIRKSVGTFFNEHPDFNIRQNSIYQILNDKDALQRIPEKHRAETIRQVKTLQRVQAVSPTNEAVSVMMKANINSAHQITEIPQSLFMSTFSKKLGEEVANKIYDDATSLKVRNEHALISMKEIVQGSGIAAVDAGITIDDRKADIEAKAKETGIPVSWEYLFGNIDFCECSDCTSVYSPASYFVELLQYLRNGNLDPAATGVQAIKPDPKDISGTVLEKLFRRRPDLGCLELTCANTNTVIPYVDLVNEVLESFIIHLSSYSASPLDPKQATIEAWNVDDETTEELLAQPQHINNDAYRELKKSVYPFTLPYDRPIDMIRIFLKYLDTSRYELMSTFRKKEQFTMIKEVMPEGTTLPPTPSPDPDEAKVPAFNAIVSDRATDSEFLSITQEEYIMLTKEAFLPKAYFAMRTPGITDAQYQTQIGVRSVPEYYGYSGSTALADMLSTNETDQKGLTFVKKQFLRRTGVTYKDLIELLQTESLNPRYPKGKALMILKSIPFSYRYLQAFVDKSETNPEKRLAKVIEVLKNPEKYIPGFGIEIDPCKTSDDTKPAFMTADIRQWVLCYLERIGKMIVLENNTPVCDCVEGQFFHPDGGEIIQVAEVEGSLFLTKECKLILKRRSFEANVGQLDSVTGVISLTDRNGRPLDLAILERPQLVFKGNKGQSGRIDRGRLIDQLTLLPFTCRQIQKDNCDLDTVRLKHLDGSELESIEYDKIHRFIRLWNKIGWTIPETDKAIVGLTADQTTYTLGYQNACDPEVEPDGFAEISVSLIHQLVAVKKLLQKTDLDIIRLLTFWTDINTTGESPLYSKLFLTHNVLAIDEVFKADKDDNYLTLSEKVVDHIPVLMAAFHVKYEDIEALVSPGELLTLPKISVIFRHILIAKALHVKTSELKDIFILFGNPFADADQAVDFFTKWDALDEAGFTFHELNYIIQGNDNPLKPLKPSRISTIKLSKQVFDGLNAIESTHRDLSNLDEATVKMLTSLSAAAKKALLRKIATADLVRSKISLLYDQEASDAIMGILQGTTSYSAPVPTTLVTTIDDFTSKFPNSTPAQVYASKLLLKKVSYDFTLGTLQVSGILTTTETATCKALFSSTAWKKGFDIISEQVERNFNDLFTAIFGGKVAAAKPVILQGDVADPDDPDKDTAPVKREYFLDTFIPYLRTRLAEILLVRLLSERTNLAIDVADVLMRDVLEGASAKKVMQILKEATLLPSPGTIGWKGYLTPISTENYIFSVDTKAATFSVRLDGEVIIDQTTALTDKLYQSAPVKLKAGQFFAFEITGLAADFNALSWSRPDTVRSTIPGNVLLPENAFNSVEEGHNKLFKAAIIVNNLSLESTEVSWLYNHPADFDGFDFNAIKLLHLLRLSALIGLRDSLQQSDLTLVDFFKWTYTTTPSTVPSEKIAELLSRKKEEIDALITPAHFDLMLPKDFSNEKNLLKLQRALFVFDKINIKIDLLFDWAQAVSLFDICDNIAQQIRKSIQARYKQTDWEKIVKPLNDQLRNHQKQALIDYLLVQPPLIKWGVVDADSLFEFFLIDVQMDTCMQTSRLKQAISSVQLFIQRCCLGLEEKDGVTNGILDRERLKVLQRNPLWVAHRKVFLYCENWLLTKFRDDKSQFFRELESELLQKDISKQDVEDALRSYISKLDEIANLKVVGLFIEEAVTGKVSVGDKVHIFASTRSTPFTYYYRHYKTDEKNWMPWEKMQVDIPSYDVKNDDQEVIGNGCYLIPIVFGKRLMVFFPQMTQKTRPNKSKDKKVSEVAETDPADTKPLPYWEIKMAWTEYRNSKWTKKQVCNDVIYYPDGGIGDISLGYPPLANIYSYSFIPHISPLNNYFYIFIHHNKTLINNGNYNSFLFMDGYLRKNSANIVIINSGYPTNFHYGANGSTNQIHSLQIDSGSFGYEVKAPYFSDESSGELFHHADNSKSGFYYPYSHELLKKINIDNLSDLFSFNLTIKDISTTSTLNELLEAFGKIPSGLSHELKSPNAIYTWEVFFYIPLCIAQQLSASNQFEEAMKWYHYIFDPTAKGTDPKRFWNFLPFKEITPASLVESLFNVLKPNTSNAEITEWRNHPFQPHVIARSRPSAYMKWVIMCYIENLIAWGDYLFKQDTIETVNYATQLYVLAGHILGPRPEAIPRRGKIKSATYNLLLDKWDAFGNAMVELELIAPFSNQITSPVGTISTTGETKSANIFGFASSLYFCIPTNPKLMEYWNILADRLFKIRHCENIKGVFRMLPLWDPPIDPALLVAATAQGLSLDSVLSELNSPLPNFRFSYLLQKAMELCSEVRQMSNALTSVLEKKDVELLARTRAHHETSMQNLIMEVRKLQVEEANRVLEGLEQNRMTTEYRLRHYLQLVGQDLSKVPTLEKEYSEVDNQLDAPIDESGLKLIPEEKEEMTKSDFALGFQIAASAVEVLSGTLHAMPDAYIALMPLGLGVQTKYGGSHLGAASSAAARVLNTISSIYSYESAGAQRKAGFRRQLQDRVLQANLAGYECKQIDKQILSQKIRIQLTEQEITNQQALYDNATEIEDFLKNKYSNTELYEWMEQSLRSLYDQLCDLACEQALKAQQAFRFERGISTANFILPSYRDASYDGLYAGEKLLLGLKQMEAAYNENRGHDFEVTKHISLLQLDPLALIELRETGSCEFSFPEELFDMDFPGHYMRKIKTVALSIPCIAGPYTSVNATLRLLDHSYRISPVATSKKDYLRKQDEEDPRFVTARVPIEAIATSSGQRDNGLFELNFKDERYMPFEGAGVISHWRLELPPFRQFKYEKIADCIVHMSYTSKDGGNKLKQPASDAFVDFVKKVDDLSQREGLFVLFDLKNEFPNEWYKAMNVPPGPSGREMHLGNLSERLPYYTKNALIKNIKAKDIYFAVDAGFKIADLTVTLKSTALGATIDGPDKVSNDTSLYHIGDVDLSMNKATDHWTLQFANTVKEPEQMMMVVRYTLQS